MSRKKMGSDRAFLGRLAYIQKRSGLRNTGMAEILGVRPEQWSAISNGKAGLTYENAQKLEQELGFRAEWLMTGEGASLVAPDPGDSDDFLAYDPGLALAKARAPVRVTVYKCSRCRGKLEPDAEVCPHCRTLIAWEEFRQRAADKTS